MRVASPFFYADCTEFARYADTTFHQSFVTIKVIKEMSYEKLYEIDK